MRHVAITAIVAALCAISIIFGGCAIEEGPTKDSEAWENAAEAWFEVDAGPVSENASPDGTHLWMGDDSSWHYQRGSSCSDSATPATRCDYECIDPVPPPTEYGGPNPWADISHGLSCCACTSWYGGCGDPNWCANSINAPGIRTFKSGPFEPGPGNASCQAPEGTNDEGFCYRCKDAPQYLPNTDPPQLNPDYANNDWRGHSVGADGICRTLDDGYVGTDDN